MIGVVENNSRNGRSERRSKNVDRSNRQPTRDLGYVDRPVFLSWTIDVGRSKQSAIVVRMPSAST